MYSIGLFRLIFVAIVGYEWYIFSMKKKIGLMLATIQQGSSTKMWREIVKTSKEKDFTVVVYPGGRLDFSGDYEYLRNDIYNLANSENIDGLIAWSSSLAGSVTPEGVKTFLTKYEEMFPLVTIGLSTGKSSNIDFDAYFGMMSEINHFIHVHGTRRIVFVRGPKNHKSAEIRYQAYKDSLKSAGIEYSDDLVTEPYPWSEGAKALKELIKEKGLIPGMDFDAVICASDLLLMGVEKYLESIKVDIPNTVRIGGFNDSEENRLSEISTTTVRMPVDKMAKVAVSTMSDILTTGINNCMEVSLPSDLVIRRSCGCKDSLGGIENAKEIIFDKDSFINWLVNAIRVEKATSGINAFIDYLLDISKSMKPGELEKAEKRFSNLLDAYFERELSVELLLEAIKWFLLLLDLDDKFIAYIGTVFVPLVSERLSRRYSITSYERGVFTKKLDSFKSELLALRSFNIIPELLNVHLKDMDFLQAYLVLNVDDDYSRLIGGYSEDNVYSESIVFPSSKLLPQALEENLEEGAFIVEPLFIDKQSLGYLLLEVTNNQDENMIEDLRASISSAIKGINLLEEANRAKERAEKAERDSSEFYANVSEGLREPLSEMARITKGLKSDERTSLSIHLAKAEHLLDLKLSEKGEMELNKSLISLKEFVSEIEKDLNVKISLPEELPSFFADKERIKQAIEILYDKAKEEANDKVEISVQIRPDTLLVHISSPSWNPMLQKRDTSLSLAERIVMLHSGSFHFKEHGISLLLSWPTLSGEEISPYASFGSLLYITSDLDKPLPEVIKNLPQVQVVSEESLVQHFEIGEEVGQLAWNINEERGGNSVVLNLLKKHQKSKSLPFLCFNLESSPLDFWSTLETHTTQRGDEIILVEGEDLQFLSALSSFGSVVFCEDSEAVLRNSEGKHVSLILLRSLNTDFIYKVRKDANLASTPILIVKDHFKRSEVEEICQIPHIIICNTSICEADEFVSRLVGILGGNELMPPLTSALVKKAIIYLNKNATNQISRWQLAESVNISEDYLTRIFRKNIGISPWDYLNRYRIQLACELLTQTGQTISEVASNTGFQDQAYFCRVFKKIKGYSPGQVRTRRKG